MPGSALDDMRGSALEARLDRAQRAEVGSDAVACLELQGGHAGSSGDYLSRSQAHTQLPQLVGEPGQRHARIAQHIGALALAGVACADLGLAPGARPGPACASRPLPPLPARSSVRRRCRRSAVRHPRGRSPRTGSPEPRWPGAASRRPPGPRPSYRAGCEEADPGPCGRRTRAPRPACGCRRARARSRWVVPGWTAAGRPAARRRRYGPGRLGWWRRSSSPAACRRTGSGAPTAPHSPRAARWAGGLRQCADARTRLPARQQQLGCGTRGCIVHDGLLRVGRWCWVGRVPGLDAGTARVASAQRIARPRLARAAPRATSMITASAK